MAILKKVWAFEAFMITWKKTNTMTEIRSTLDLVMEKTRNLTFSSEEKRALQVKDARKGFNGLLQRYLDGLLELDEVQKGVTRLEEKFELGDRGVLRKVVVDKLAPESMRGPLLVLLEQVFGCDTTALRALGKDYKDEIATRADDRRRELAAYFEERFEVVGTAVFPNLEADAKWLDETTTLHGLYAAKLEVETARL